MKTVIEMAREASGDDWGLFQDYMPEIHRLVELVRADERNSWPAEMEAMERQVNILTDALNDRQRWFDAMTAQHKQAILAEREACAKVVEQTKWSNWFQSDAAAAIRTRSNT